MAKKRRQTGRNSRLLEQSIEALQMLNFQVFDSHGQFEKAVIVSDRYIIRNYAHPSLYGTSGRKEACIVGRAGRLFRPESEGTARIIVEAKYQDASGSVDEKFPYVYEAFLHSPVANWLVIIEGRYWKEHRGKAAVKWLKNRPVPSDRTFRVLNGREFNELARKAWGR